jgi:sialic acid synthase SpsE
MVTAIRETEKVLGSGEVDVLDAEEELHEIARRRIHAARDIEAGEVISEDDMEILRSGRRREGAEPKYYQRLVGMEANKYIHKGDGISLNYVR